MDRSSSIRSSRASIASKRLFAAATKSASLCGNSSNSRVSRRTRSASTHSGCSSNTRTRSCMELIVIAAAIRETGNITHPPYVRKRATSLPRSCNSGCSWSRAGAQCGIRGAGFVIRVAIYGAGSFANSCRIPEPARHRRGPHRGGVRRRPAGSRGNCAAIHHSPRVRRCRPDAGRREDRRALFTRDARPTAPTSKRAPRRRASTCSARSRRRCR